MRLQEIEKRLNEIKAELEKDGADIDALEKEANDLINERKQLLDKAEKRNKIISDIAAGAGTPLPNIVVPKDDRKDVSDIEKRAKKLVETGRMSISAEETRSILLSTGSLAKPTSVGGITEPFNVVSSIVDMVFVDDLTGVGAHKEAYMKSWQSAKENTAYGTAPDPSDPEFRTVAINPFPIDVLTYVGKNLRRQTPLAYEEKVRKGALIALRKKVAAWIVKGNGTTQAYGIYNAINTEAVPESLIEEYLVAKDYRINDKTLRNLVLAYGGDENIGTGAKLFLKKTDLIAFGDVRGTNEKKAVYEIIPDGTNPNTGIIKDGGLSVPYVICSDVTALTRSAETGAARIKTMIYGNPYNYKLGLFGDFEVTVSDDYKFGEGLLTVKGEAMVGGNVYVDKGFIVLTKKANADG